VKCLAFIVLASAFAFGQSSGNMTMLLFPGVPTGTCNSRQMAMDLATGQVYSCFNSAWQVLAGGGSGWNPPNVAGDTIFGNNTVSTGQPSFFVPGGDVSFSSGSFSVNSLHFGPTGLLLTNTGIATGNCLTISSSTLIGGPCGGGAGLNGCSTPTAGNLDCTNSVAVTNTGSGTLTLTGVGPGVMQLGIGTLPNPPTGSTGALAADASGILNWSPGSNAPFTPVTPTGGGGQTGPLGGVVVVQ
jgi:hypothetical protein